MAEEIITTTAEGGDPTPQEAGERTFTTDEVNRIVQERLAKERKKTESELDPREQALIEREQALVKREFDLHANQVLKEKQLPAQLLNIIKADDIKMFDKNIGVLSRLIEEVRQAKHEEVAAMFLKPKELPRVGPYTPMPNQSDSIRGAMGLDK